MFELLNVLDNACGALPPLVRVMLYGLVIGIVGMLIYWLLSPQAKIKALKSEMTAAQKALRAYKGTDGRQILRLSRQSISPALRHSLLVLGPGLAAMLPVLLIMGWLESEYTYAMPRAGDLVAVHSGTAGILWMPSTAGSTTIRWPDQNQIVMAIDRESKQELFRLPLAHPFETIKRWQWWDWPLRGPDQPRLPASAAVDHVRFDLARRQICSVCPQWMRYWQTPFIIALTIATLAMKFLVKIE